MNILANVEHLKNLLQSLRIKPKDYMGQNFLISEDVLDEIMDASEIKKSDTIVEIGPGLGTLTERLAPAAHQVIAIEKDRRFISILKRSQTLKNVQIIESDVLRFNFGEIKSGYKIVANIPYYLTSHLLQMLLALGNKPSRIVFMVQKEVAERLVAKAGELSILGISVQIFADVEIIATVPKENFWPQPKVDSAIVLIMPRGKFPEITDQKLFFRIIKIAFAGKRKQIHNSLANGLKLPKEQIETLLKKSNITPTLRPQDLSLEQWIDLYKTIQKINV